MPDTAPADLTPKARRTRAALIRAARELVGRDGVASVTVMAVCAAAGVGRTSFYNYFDSAGALVGAVAQEAASGVRERFERLHAEHPRGLARLEACLDMILTLAVEEAQEVLLITALATATPEVGDLLKSEILKELAADGPSDDAMQAQADFLSIATLALARQFAQGHLPPDSRRHHLGFLLRTVRPSAPTPAR